MYSQNDEERIIGDYFAAHGGVGRFFLDIGAHDGVKCSNTRALALAGWSGVLVEPAPNPFAALLELYGAADDKLLVNAAIAETAGLTTFHDAGGDMVGSLRSRHVAKWSAEVEFHPFVLCAVTPAMLLEFTGGRFDLISVDVEGVSANVFRLLANAGADARCWCVEHDGQANAIAERGCGMGLNELARNAENIILAKP